MLCKTMRDISTPTALCQLSLLHGPSQAHNFSLGSSM